MKIAWLTHQLPYPPVGRGVLQRTHHLLKRACSRHEVHLLAFSRSSHPILDDEREAVEHLSDFCSSVTTARLPSDRSRLRWAWVVASSFFSPESYTERWLDSPRMRRQVEETSADEELDLLFLDTIGLGPYADCVPSVPFVQQHHNVESDMMAQRAEKTSNPLKRAYFRRESRALERHERRVARRAEENVVVSELDGSRLREVAGDVSTAVVENGVDVDYFRPRTPPGEGSEGLVFAGGMEWYPNRDAVLWFVREIWPALLEDDGTRRATIIGSSPPRELREAADDPQLRVPGFVDDVRPHVDRALAYVCPIRDGGGTRLKILDALAMGKPLVATEFSVQGLDLVEGEHYLRAESPEEYVRQVSRLESDPELRRSLAVAGRTFVEERFSWDALAPDLFRVLDRARRDGTPSG